jgi:hypothetical protein
LFEPRASAAACSDAAFELLLPAPDLVPDLDLDLVLVWFELAGELLLELGFCLWRTSTSGGSPDPWFECLDDPFCEPGALAPGLLPCVVVAGVVLLGVVPLGVSAVGVVSLGVVLLGVVLLWVSVLGVVLLCVSVLGVVLVLVVVVDVSGAFSEVVVAGVVVVPVVPVVDVDSAPAPVASGPARPATVKPPPASAESSVRHSGRRTPVRHGRTGLRLGRSGCERPARRGPLSGSLSAGSSSWAGLLIIACAAEVTGGRGVRARGFIPAANHEPVKES